MDELQKTDIQHLLNKMKKTIIHILSLAIVSCTNIQNKKESNTSAIDPSKKNDSVILAVNKQLDTTAKNDKWETFKINGKTIIFNNNVSFNTPLFDLDYIGKLDTKKKNTIFYFVR